MNPFLIGTDSNRPTINRRRSRKSCQHSGTLTCRYCPFRTDSTQYILQHEQQHNANLGSQCSFCTFSAGNMAAITVHINRVHPEQKNNSTDMNEGLEQLGLGMEAMDLENSKGDQAEDLLLPQNTAQPNDIQQNVAEKEVIDITMQTDDEESDEEEDDTEEFSCICGQSQPIHKDNFMIGNEDQFVPLISCYECGKRFHGLCVGITPADYKQMETDGGKWFCPPCIHKETPITFNKKLFKAVDSLAKQFPPPLDLSEGTRLSPREEEVFCRSQLSKLELEIQSVNTKIVNMKNLKKEEDRVMTMARSKTANELRKKMDELQTKDRAQSIELGVLMEHNERFQQQLKEFTVQKIQLEKEIANLGEFSSENKLKLESLGLNSSAAFEEIGVKIQEKKDSLSEVKEKLDAALKVETNTRDRIRNLGKERIENNVNLDKMRNDLDFLNEDSAAVSPSATAVLLETLKEEQYKRIETFISLEKKLVQLCFGYVIDEVVKKKEERLSALNDYDEY